MGEATAVDLADLVRIVGVVTGFATFAVSLLTTVAYGFAYRAHRYGDEPWAGLLPRHVIIIGFAYLLLLGGSVSDLLEGFGSGWSWRPPVYAVANVAGAFALWDILGFERRRVQDLSARR